jgi:hypothetical protein
MKLSNIQRIKLLKAEGIKRTVLISNDAPIPSEMKIRKEVLCVNECIDIMFGLLKLADEAMMDVCETGEISQKTWRILKHLRKFNKEARQRHVGATL